jgi:hypothetical protein
MEKILYRRARAHFLLGELNPAAQDLLTVLSIDSKNTAASKLLNTIRLVHATQRTENTPLARLVRQIKEETGTAEETTTPTTDGLHLVDKVKALFSLLSQDTSALAWEFGRIGGFQTIWSMATTQDFSGGNNNRIRVLALQIISSVCSLKEFARQFAIPPHLEQTDLVNLIVKYCHSTSSASESPSAVIVAGIALYLRLVLAFDEKEAIAVATDTNTNTDTSEGAVINNDGLCQA